MNEVLSNTCVVLIRRNEMEFFSCPFEMEGLSSIAMKIGEKRFKLNKDEILSFKIQKRLTSYKVKIETKDDVEVFFAGRKLFGKNWIDENVEYIKELLK